MKIVLYIFTKLTQDLDNCNEKLTKDHLAVVLLNSISNMHKYLKNILKYDGDKITTEIIINAPGNRNLELKDAA